MKKGYDQFPGAACWMKAGLALASRRGWRKAKNKISVLVGLAACNKAKIGVAVWPAECKKAEWLAA